MEKRRATRTRVPQAGVPHAGSSEPCSHRLAASELPGPPANTVRFLGPGPALAEQALARAAALFSPSAVPGSAVQP